MKHIKDTTLVCVDCIHIDDSIKALQRTLEECSFDAVKLFTSLPCDYSNKITIQKIGSIKEYSHFIIKELYKYIETKYILLIQHDGWVIDSSKWVDDFYDFDYIGGICNWMDVHRKGGNGGFSFRTTNLMKAASEVIPSDLCHPEDVALSSMFKNQKVNGSYVTGFRDGFERMGFKFADVSLQEKFSFDCGPYKNTFGHHKCDLINHYKYKEWFGVNLDYQYKSRCGKKSDINEHLPTLAKYTKLCNTVTEFGVRGANSSYGIMNGNPKSLISYDIENVRAAKDVSIVAKDNNIDYKFIVADTKNITIQQTDLLFIDTEHTYKQLYIELTKHSKMVNKYIIMHDTETFGKNDRVKTDFDKTGLTNAISDFLNTEDGKNWNIVEHFKNNNGLTILQRNSQYICKETITVLYRYHDKDFVSDRKISSLKTAFNNFKYQQNKMKMSGKFFLICDNISDDVYSSITKISEEIIPVRISSKTSEEKFRHRGHYSFYITSLELVKQEYKDNIQGYIFFCEDDYDYTSDAFEKAISLMCEKNEDFLSLYDHPDRYKFGSISEDNHPLHKPYKTEIIYDKKTNHHWRTSISTCHSFCCTSYAIKDIMNNSSIFSKRYGDHQMWVEIWKTNRHKLWTPIPGLAIHWGGPHFPLK